MPSPATSEAAIVIDMHWRDLPNHLNGILVAATLVTVCFAWQTVRIASAARSADERYRQLADLRSIYRLVVTIGRIVDTHQGPGAAPLGDDWYFAELDELAHTLVGVVPQLPKCRALTTARGPVPIKSAGAAARDELTEVFRSLGAEGG
jgi:hypothetical protein